MRARRKFEPMVIGLFPRREQISALTMLEDSVTFVTGVNIDRLLFDCAFDGSAWTLAKLYLVSLDLELLGTSAPRLVGFREERTCCVSMAYFRSTDPFADFIVHATAHILHNCKRSAAGLPETLTRVWCSISNTACGKSSRLPRGLCSCDGTGKEPSRTPESRGGIRPGREHRR